MYFRHHRMYETETIAADAEWNDVLPEGGLLDHILLTLRMTNKNTQYDSPEPLILDHINKIEVKAGGKEPLKDYWGQSCLAEYAYATGRVAPAHQDVMSSNIQTQTFPILFGKKPFDGNYALDLSGDEIRLAFSNDLQDDDWNGSNFTMDMDLVYLEDPLTAPTNFFQTYQKTQHTWTAASQKKKWIIPSGDKVRRIMVGCESPRSSATGGPSNKSHRNCRHVKYTYNSGGVHVIDNDMFRHDQDVLWGYDKLIETFGSGESRASIYLDTQLCRPITLSVTPTYSAAGSAYGSVKMDQRLERFSSYRAVETAGEQNRWRALGYGYLDHFLIREDQPDIEERYLDPTARKNVELEIGNSVSGATTGIIRLIIQALKSQPS